MVARSRSGSARILVRGGTVLQLAAKVDTVVFRQDGTVTEGRFEIVKIVALNSSEEDVLQLARQPKAARSCAGSRIVRSETPRSDGRGLRMYA